MFGNVMHPIKSSDDIDISGKRTKHCLSLNGICYRGVFKTQSNFYDRAL